MSVTVDHEPLAVGELGLTTIGEVFSHVHQQRRLVVQVLLDGQSPLPGELGALRQTTLRGHTLYIETADPRQLAIEVLDDVAAQIEDAGRVKDEVAHLLQSNQAATALQRLGACVRTWQHTHEAVAKTAELLRIDPADVPFGDRSLADLLADFAAQLRQVRTSLEQRDYVALSDVLLYDMADATAQWNQAIDSMRSMVNSLR